jgi:hypothetical protein
MHYNFDVPNLNPFNQDQKLFGMTLGQWTVRWWQWLLSCPKDINPALDGNGCHADVNQSGPVWFLAGTFGEHKYPRRQCAIPRNKYVLFPVINYEINIIEKSTLHSDMDLINDVVEDMNDIVHLEAVLDKNAVPIHRIQSDPKTFLIELPPNNCMGITGGRIKCAADGYWVFLQCLSPGKHTIYFHGACSGGFRNSTAEYSITVS